MYVLKMYLVGFSKLIDILKIKINEICYTHTTYKLCFSTMYNLKSMSKNVFQTPFM